MPRKPPKDRGGRPTKCTKTLLLDLATLIVKGAHPNVALASLGVSKDSRLRWQEKGAQNPASIFGDFCAVMEGKHALAKAALAIKLHAYALQGDTPAAKLWLQHVRAEGFESPNLAVPVLPLEEDDDALRAALATKLARLAQSR